MKIAFFTSHILWETHYEAELEIIQSHLDEGHIVYQYVCNGTMHACDGNQDHGFFRCVNCMAKRRCGKALLSNDIRQTPYLLLTPDDKNKINTFINELPLDILEFKKLKYDHFDVGYAVASSIITFLANPSPDIKQHYHLFLNHTKAALEVYCSFLNRLEEDRPDLLYIFNGRLAQVKAAFRAANKLNIPCYIHERGNNVDRYGVFKNHLPHDIRKMGELMRSFWNENPDVEEKKKLAAFFYEKRRNGILLSWKSFTDKQTAGLLPEDFDPQKRNMVFFNSSDFEFAAIGPEWNHKIYKDQYDGIITICRDMAVYDDIHFYLRIHPNLATADPGNFEKISNINAPNLTLIMPDSPIDSYHLLDAAEKVITFGSTMGMEATWWNKPSILAGPCLYENLKAVHRPGTHQELMDLLLNPELEPCDRADASVFGYFYAAFGTKYKYYKPKDYKSGVFKDTEITAKLNKSEERLMKLYWRLRGNKILKGMLERTILNKLNA
jgi:hypothetical protein